MNKHTYMVRPGRRFGFGKKYGPGDTVELTESEARGFLDLLELVVQSPEPEPDKTQLLPAKIIEALHLAGIEPEQTAALLDEDLLVVSGIGPAALKTIREAYPAGNA